MNPRINFITIAVKDLQKSVRFYKEGFGLPTKGVAENEGHALFSLADGFSLVLYSHEAFLKVTGQRAENVMSSGFIISHIAASKREVDEILAQALHAGAQQIRETKDEPWGYGANFTDPDGHPLKITYMPGYNK
jgi:hypothetical protein